MRILVIGGTRFVGRHLVEAALEAGHEVTLFHRGRTGADLFPELDHRLGDRDTDLSTLAEGEWDATIDTCAYVPRQVHQLADLLGERGGHHLLVSSVSVYAEPKGPGIDEDAALIELEDPSTEEVTNETYGGLKVLCERAAVERHGPRTVLVRPTYVVGPDDYTWRFPWWVARIARGGEVVAPGPGDAPAQVIDVRDLGTWMVRLLEEGHSGAFHAASPAPVFTWREQLEAIAEAVGPAGTTLRWVAPGGRGCRRCGRWVAAVERRGPRRVGDGRRSGARVRERADAAAAGGHDSGHARLDRDGGDAARHRTHRRPGASAARSLVESNKRSNAWQNAVMAGGMNKRGGGIPMEQRVLLGAALGASEGPTAEPNPGEAPARHCWVLAPADGSGERRAGLLLEWRRGEAAWECRVLYNVRLRTGAWALLEEWLPSSDVAPAEGMR